MAFPKEFAKPDFWSHPEKRLTGDKNAARIYYAVGRSLTQWELLETMMALLFGVFNGRDARAATQAYGTLNGTQGRADAIKYAGNAYFFSKDKSENYIKQLKDVLLAYNNASWKRNDIGHGVVTRFWNDDAKEDYGYFLTPPSYASKKVDFAKMFEGSGHNMMFNPLSYALTAQDIMIHCSRFESMMHAVREFGRAIWTAYDAP